MHTIQELSDKFCCLDGRVDTLNLGNFLAADLPAAPSGSPRAFVTNSNTTTFNATVAGGGANVVPVFWNGANWKVG